MRKVANRKIIRKLSFRTMKEKKWKNLIAVLAIGLTTLLFTALFTVGGSLISTMEEGTMRQVGMSAHGGYKYLSMQEYEQVKAAGGFTEITYDIIAGFGANPELSAIQTEVRYGEDRAAQLSFAYPETGHMPRGGKECVASSKILEALGVPMELGAKVPLSIISHDEQGNERLIEEEFVLSGYYMSNEASHAQEFWISRQWLEEHVPLLQENFNKHVEKNGVWTADGSIQAMINFSSAYDIERQMEELTSRAGLTDQVHIGVNWAYATSEIDMTTLLLGIIILAIIILSGYLIIYNIFYINVTADIRYYGLLKTIGTTGRQLRRMVHQQALFLSGAGIPLGLISGFLVGRGILPAIYGALNTNGIRKVSLNPWIFVGSAIFALFTVYISCIRPCRLAARVSPIEAVRYVEGGARYKKGKVKPKERKSRSGRITAAGLAFANMGRNRKKAVIVIASLSLSLVLINATYGLVKGFSFESYVQDYLMKDMQVGHAFTVNHSGGVIPAMDVVTPELKEMLLDIEGVEEIASSNYHSGTIYLSGKVLEQFTAYYRSGEFLGGSLPYMEEAANERIEEQTAYASNYYLDEALLPYLTISKGNFDREKFMSGGYAILLQTVNEDPEDWWLRVGDKFSLGSNGDEETGEFPKKELEIMAIGTIPYSITIRMYTVFSSVLLLCEKDFEELYDSNGSLHACLTVADDKEEQVAATVEETIKQYNPELVLTTKETMKQEFANEMSMFSVTGGLLSGILALIGILNMINALITGILARRQEFAMMQAVGMTGGQLRKMLTWEGIWYGIWTLGIAATIGNLVSYGVLYLMGNVMSGFQWSFQPLPLLISIPVIALRSVALPVLCYHGLCRISIVERLRMAEV